jgi:hypothetical protein
MWPIGRLGDIGRLGETIGSWLQRTDLLHV